MKIVYVAKSFLPSRMANSIHVMNMCAAFAKLGHDVTLLIPDDKNYRTGENLFDFYGIEPTFVIKKLNYPSIKGKTLFYTFDIFKMLLKISPDVVLGRFVNGCAIASILNIPTVFDTHGPIWLSKIETLFFKIMLKQKGLKRITTNSRALKRMYEETHLFDGKKFDKANIVVANNGANNYPLTDLPISFSRTHRFNVGYFGHLYEGRGIEIIVELAKIFPEVDFYVGGGEEKDIEFWEGKAKLNNMYFLGYIRFGDVYKYRNLCDVLLAPYQEIVSPGGEVADQGPYMNPIKLIEYMSSCKGIIASDLASVREVLTNNVDALLVKFDDVSEWARALERIMKDDSFRDQIAMSAYEKFLEKHSWEKRAAKMIENI